MNDTDTSTTAHLNTASADDPPFPARQQLEDVRVTERGIGKGGSGTDEAAVPTSEDLDRVPTPALQQLVQTGEKGANDDLDGDDDEGDDEGDEDAANEGTIDEVMARVGDDPELAQSALAAEQAEAKPRSSLVEKLQAVIDAAEDDGDDDDGDGS